MCCCAPFWGYIPPMSLQNSKFPSKLESAEMADGTEFFYTSVSKQPVIAGALVSVNDLHAGLSSVVFPVKQITQNPVVAIPYRFDPGHRHHQAEPGCTKRTPLSWGAFCFAPASEQASLCAA